MKRIILSLCLGLFSASAMAAHGPSGCGLGSVLFKGKSGLFFHVIAATTNGSSGNQTFGMSTGTLGCSNTSTTKVAAVEFIEQNRQAMIVDVALGGGDVLSAYLEIIGRNNGDVGKIQQNFAKIFSPEKAADQIHESITAIL